MSEDNDQVKDELFESSEESEETGSDAVSTTPEGEENKGSAALENAQKQIDVYTQRVANGEIEVDDITQDWIKKGVEKSLNLDIDVEAVVEKKLAAKEEERAYQSLKAELNKMSLSDDEKKALKEEFDDLANDGVARSKALAKAMKIAGISSVDQRKTDTLRQNMSLPPAGATVRKGAQIDGDNHKDFSPEDRIAYYEKLRKADAV